LDRSRDQSVDDAAVDALERLMAAQRSAPTPWVPVADYTDEGRRAIEGRNPALILQHLVNDADEVLDFGCGPASHLVRLLREEITAHGRDVVVQGYDPQIAGSQRHIGYDLKYDLVICREVLEHLTLRELIQTVRTLCRLSDGLVYVTTRFAQAPAHLLTVDTSDSLDPTHITMLTPAFLRLLFVAEGFRRRPDLERAMDWQHKGRVLVYERA
jgi:2-polyprenyl-3-methyl-5-hydroxy-6-metoxy-1,4-benzoquinol methylase